MSKPFGRLFKTVTCVETGIKVEIRTDGDKFKARFNNQDFQSTDLAYVETAVLAETAKTAEDNWTPVIILRFKHRGWDEIHSRSMPESHAARLWIVPTHRFSEDGRGDVFKCADWGKDNTFHNGSTRLNRINCKTDLTLPFRELPVHWGGEIRLFESYSDSVWQRLDAVQKGLQFLNWQANSAGAKGGIGEFLSLYERTLSMSFLDLAETFTEDEE